MWTAESNGALEKLKRQTAFLEKDIYNIYNCKELVFTLYKEYFEIHKKRQWNRKVDRGMN